jgi:diguanylate cyclase (GGDEF)-like protein/PAS domain S-box-containing protein
MIFHLRLYGTIISVIRYCARHLNLSSDELTSLPIDDFIHSEDKDLFRILFDACITHPQRVHKQELRMIRQDGSDLWVRATARIVVDEQQQQNLLLVCEDITETRLLNQKIIYQARHDTLTGLANRNEFDEYLQKAVTTALTGKQEHALCYLDLDQFKVVNDTSGHLAGDELLRQLSVLLKKHIRKGDLLARLGGDEFGILIHNCSSIEAYRACDHLKNIIRSFYFVWEDRRFSVGVSIGIVIIDKHTRNTIDALKAADSACYAAKELGRNRVHIFSPDDKDLASRQGEMRWLEKIQYGVENNRFVLFGQPIVALTEKNTGLHFEVLLRYQDDLGRFVPPGAFLPAAERYQKTPAIDKWVIRTLFKWLSNCPEFLNKLSLCSINLSGLSLSDETIQPFIIKQFNIWNIPAHKICFEITETAAISNLAYATKFIHFLQQQGCTFSLDDFGSGLSSFAYLKALPVDFLKIDGQFVKDILTDKVDLAMVKSINEVAHVMGKKTIAEFVENQAICQCLCEIGVDYAQGFGIAKPMPLEQLESFNYVSSRAKVTHE